MSIDFFKRRRDSLNIESTVIALSEKAASIRFKQASERLLNVTKWHTLPCSLLSELRLTDEAGNNIERHVRENDYFVFNSLDGGVEEWVKVETLQFVNNQIDSSESVVMCARPSQKPIDELDVCASPVSPANTFRVFRKGLNVTVAVHGDNEHQEASGSGSIKSALGAIPGVARVQWRSLVNGILSTWK